MSEPRFTDTFDSFCPMCTEPVLQSQTTERSHQIGAATISFKVCPSCKDRTLCTTMYGVHGEILDLSDALDPHDDVASIRVFVRADIDINSIPQSAQGRIGYCVICEAIQVWDVDKGRWRDYRGESIDDCPPLPCL